MSGSLRLASTVSLVLSFAAFIASLLALLSGSTPSFLPEGEMLSLNISRIGQTPIFGSASTANCKRNLFDTIGNGINCAAGAAESGINNVVGNVAGDVADALNLPDFFDVHVRNFCTGEFEPKDYVEQGITNPKKNITFCSSPSLNFNFDPTQIVQNALPQGVTLADIKWPSTITDATVAVKIATHILTFAFIGGISAAGLTALFSIIGIITAGSFTGCLSLLTSNVGFLALLVSSIASSAIIFKATAVVNADGSAIGIAADKGIIFLALTWGATGAMLICSLISVFGCCARRRYPRYLEV